MEALPPATGHVAEEQGRKCAENKSSPRGRKPAVFRVHSPVRWSPLPFATLAARLNQQPYSKEVLSKIPRTNRLSTICNGSTARQELAVRFAKGARPIVHGDVYKLMLKYWQLQVSQSDPSTECEQAVAKSTFFKGLDRSSFLDRFVKKRPLVFYNETDMHMLRDGTHSVGRFDTIGTVEEDETSAYILKNYMSYDEMALSSMLAISSHTFFINNGDRWNLAKPGDRGSFVPYGVYIGMVGARFEIPGKMEWVHMMIDPKQNTPENGYGRNRSANASLELWAEFYGVDYFPSYEEVKASAPASVESEISLTDKFVEVYSPREPIYLNCDVYRRRMRVAAETFLIEANDRAKAMGKKAHCFVVGIGLGVWSRHRYQSQMLLDAYAFALASLALEAVACVEFSWFKTTKFSDGVPDIPQSISIKFSRNRPATPLPNPELLLVAQYAWDGNAYPGNEYWIGLLSASGDPAAACCSCISELQNPDVNPQYVSGTNLHVAVNDVPEASLGLVPARTANPLASDSSNPSPPPQCRMS